MIWGPRAVTLGRSDLGINGFELGLIWGSCVRCLRPTRLDLGIEGVDLGLI